MKTTMVVLCLLIATTISAQDDWSVKNSTLTMKESAPIWPGCEAKDAAKRDACFNKKLISHIQKNFRYPAAEYKKNIQGEVLVEFIINKKGMVEITSASGGNKGLQESAKKTIMSIPKMKPGMFGGKPSVVSYTVPFTFKTGK